MKKHILSLMLLLTAVSLTGVRALENRISMGVGDNWNDLGVLEGVTFVEGKRGYPDVVLRDAEYAADTDTELLLHFNNGEIAGKYTLQDGKLEITRKISRFGAGSGLFLPGETVAVLKPAAGALFAPGVSWGDFTIEFWLYPATLDEGSVIISWQGSRFAGEKIVSQKVNCTITEGRLLWRFENVFLPADYGESYIELKGRRPLIPKLWKHHLLRYDSTTNLLEYTVSDVPEAITYATDTSRESGKPYVPFTGDDIDNVLKIGGSLNGLLDELRISKRLVTEPQIDTYAQNTGTVSTRVFDLGYSNSVLTRVDAETATPGDTGIIFFYRISERITSSNSVAGEWRQFAPGRTFDPATRGRYLQVLAELYPDGSGNTSPVLSTIDIYYEPDLPPHPPGWVEVLPGDGVLTARWQAATDSDVTGYLVYYGDKPGRYFGTGSTSGDSPIDAGKVTEINLEGLINGRLYYIAVASYDSSDPPHRSYFSEEVAARPSHLHEGDGN
ncbi:MAG: hypothetical protein JW852_01640 [Spirochaetales bacterium]|nr:hypothetical protein [Spirochaetales bacterium]